MSYYHHITIILPLGESPIVTANISPLSCFAFKYMRRNRWSRYGMGPDEQRKENSMTIFGSYHYDLYYFHNKCHDISIVLP